MTVVPEAGREIVLRANGVLVDPADPAACKRALDELRALKAMVGEGERALTAAILVFSQEHGLKRTSTLPDGTRLVKEGGPKREYRADEIERGLREAGMPEERLREIVVTTIDKRVDGREAQAAAAANPAYKTVIDAATSIVDAPYRIR